MERWESEPQNRRRDSLNQTIGIGPWVVALVAIALLTLLANQVVQLLLCNVARVT